MGHTLLTSGLMAVVSVAGLLVWVVLDSMYPGVVQEYGVPVILVFSLMFTLVLLRIRRKIRAVHQSVESFARFLGVDLPASSTGDLIDRLHAGVSHLRASVADNDNTLEYRSRHDELTRLPNRTLLLERLAQKLELSGGEEALLALCIIDLDRFKEVNDTLGHPVGDRLLQEVGRRLESVLQPGDVFARLGGDEFAVLLPGADRQHSQAVCRRLLAVMDQPVKIEKFTLQTGLSIGIALSPEHGGNANLLLQRADVAMYEAKRTGSGFAFYTADRDGNSVSRLAMSGELREAIETGCLTLQYQPMITLATGSVACVEVLSRWRHPRLGMVPPDDFISLAEQTGVIQPLTLWVLDQAFSQSASWRREGIDLDLSINLSARCLQDHKLPEQIEKLVERHQVNPVRVKLEVTESAIMFDSQTARRIMRRLSNLGFKLSIDDFGTGYSSLAYLKQLPVDEVKIDKSFVTQMDRHENDAVIVRATIDLAHNLGLRVVAEGVETSDVWDLLDMLGCDALQGYFIRQPMDPESLVDWLKSREWRQVRWINAAAFCGS